MGKNWYPQIDSYSCIRCGACVEKCGNGVYDKASHPVPQIVQPFACRDGCHGCGNRCPVGAISYYGDDTGCLPPQGKEQRPDCC